jgi:hypothetical protein
MWKHTLSCSRMTCFFISYLSKGHNEVSEVPEWSFLFVFCDMHSNFLHVLFCGCSSWLNAVRKNSSVPVSISEVFHLMSYTVDSYAVVSTDMTKSIKDVGYVVLIAVVNRSCHFLGIYCCEVHIWTMLCYIPEDGNHQLKMSVVEMCFLMRKSITVFWQKNK